jgi:alcohol dehydrogenase class IV
VDPALAASMPPELTAHSALDALTHAIEAMVATLANDFSTALAMRAIRMIFKHLPAAHRSSECQARDGLHRAATLAGLAATNSTAGLVHGMDQVGPLLGLPHGLVCAVLLPHTLAFNLTAAQSAYAEMGAALGLAAGSEEEHARSFLQAVVRLERAVGLPLSFADAGVAREAYETHIDTLISTTLASASSAHSPRLPAADEARQLFMDAFEGNLPEWMM